MFRIIDTINFSLPDVFLGIAVVASSIPISKYFEGNVRFRLCNFNFKNMFDLCHSYHSPIRKIDSAFYGERYLFLQKRRNPKCLGPFLRHFCRESCTDYQQP